MNAKLRLVVVMALTAMVALPTVAAAQPSTVSLPIFAGQKVRVTSAGGRVTKGTVQAVTPTAIDLGDGTTLTSMATVDVVRIELMDSVRNGVVKGALIGVLVGSVLVAAGTALDITESLLSGDGDLKTVGEGGDGGFFLGIAAGALLGYVIDAAKVTTIYEREAGGVSVGLRPIVSAAGKGIGVRVRW